MRLALLLLPILATSAPTPNPNPNPNPALPPRSHTPLEKRGYWQGDSYVGYARSQGINCRTCANTNCTITSKYDYQAPVAFSCQVVGEVVYENKFWDLTDRGCWVADAVIMTKMMKVPGLPTCDEGQ